MTYGHSKCWELCLNYPCWKCHNCLKIWAFNFYLFFNSLKIVFKSFVKMHQFVLLCVNMFGKIWRSRVDNASVMTQFVEKFWLITSITLFLLAVSASVPGYAEKLNVEISSKCQKNTTFFQSFHRKRNNTSIGCWVTNGSTYYTANLNDKTEQK